MMNKICRFLFRRNRKLFHDLFIEDLVGEIPQSVHEPTNEFLSQAGTKFEKWILWQSWILQRKATSEPKNTEIYRGMLLELKLLLMLSTKKVPQMAAIQEEPKEKEDPLKGVDDFKKGFKKK